MAKHQKGIELVRADAFSYRPFERVADLRDVPTASFHVTYIGSWPAAAKSAFEYALNIWGNLLNSPVPIKVWAEFADLPGNTLGQAGAEFIWANFTGAPIPNTWYVAAIADKLEGSDLDPDPDVLDIGAQFDSTPGAAWYFGTDAHPPTGTVDFVTVVLHELGHGLGFAGSAFVLNGLGYWGADSSSTPGMYWPYSYDRYTRASGAPIIQFVDGSIALKNALTGGNLFFSSPVVADGDRPAITTPAKLYAPSTWIEESSYVHLDEATYPPGNANSLMTPIIGTAEANHNPGITREIFADIGWGSLSGGAAPGQPTITSAVASGGVLTVTWTSGGGGAPTSHQLSFYSFGTFVGTVNAGAGTTVNIPLPAGLIGTFGVRVTASNAAGPSPPSAQVDFTIVTGGGGAPGQPTVTSAVASGGVLTINWTSGSGAAPTEHLLAFYSGPALVTTIGVGATTSFAVPIPPGVSGTFGVRVTAFNGTVASPASNEYLFTIGSACTTPAAPVVSGGIVGGNATLNWQAVAGATSYIVSAGPAPGGTLYLPPTTVGGGPLSASGLPPGFAAWVRVIAVNACGQQGPHTDFLLQ